MEEYGDSGTLPRDDLLGRDDARPALAGLVDNRPPDTINPVMEGWYHDPEQPWDPVNVQTQARTSLASVPNSGIYLENFSSYRSPDPPLSDCTTLPPRDEPLDLGLGNIQTAISPNLDGLSHFGSSLDTLSLTGRISDFQLKAQSQHGADALNNTLVLTPESSWTQATDPDASKRPSCHLCSYESKTQSELKKHILRHTKPHRCNLRGCSRKIGFSSNSDLVRHMRSKHPTQIATGSQAYRCTLGPCSKVVKYWPRIDNFRQHLKRRHGDYDLTSGISQFIVLQPLRTAGKSSGSYNNSQRTDVELARTESEVLSDTGQHPEPTHARLSRVREFRKGVAYLKDGVETDCPQPDPISRDMDVIIGSQFDNVIADSCSDEFMGSLLEDYEGQLGFDHMDLQLDHGSTPITVEAPVGGSLPPSSSCHVQERTHNGCAASDHSSLVVTVSSKDALDQSDEDGDICLGANTGIESPQPVTGASVSACSKDHLAEDIAEGFRPNSEVACSRLSIGAAVTQENEDEQETTSTQNFDAILLETLKRGDLDAVLEQHGYKKTTDSASRYERPAPTMSKSGFDLNIYRFNCPETNCNKSFKRDCELRKHMKRHKKPYGCTVYLCKKKFGSKSDWKRHETSQHKEPDGWQCDMKAPEASTDVSGDADSACRRVFHKSESFFEHLRQDHGLSEPQSLEKVKTCEYRRYHDTYFWCGFCEQTLDARPAVVGSSSSSGGGGGGGVGVGDGKIMSMEKFDHIDYHISKETPKAEFEKWKYEEEVLVEEARKQLEPSVEPRTKTDVKAPKKKGKKPGYEEASAKPCWHCCNCRDYNLIELTVQCVFCSHYKCHGCLQTGSGSGM